MDSCRLGGALPDGMGADRITGCDSGRTNKASCVNMKEKGNTMAKKSLAWISGRCECR